MNKPHKHAELIKAWADGAKIQYKVGKTWFDAEGDPRWADITDYRIKPEPKPHLAKSHEWLFPNPVTLQMMKSSTFFDDNGQMIAVHIEVMK